MVIVGEVERVGHGIVLSDQDQRMTQSASSKTCGPLYLNLHRIISCAPCLKLFSLQALFFRPGLSLIVGAFSWKHIHTVVSEWIPSCESAHTSATLREDQVIGTMARYPTQLWYPDSEQISPCRFLL